MRLSGRAFLERLGRVAFFAVASLFLLAPGPVQAGCNNHVRTSGSSAWRTEDLAVLLQGGTAPVGDGAPTAPRECSGPSCSNNAPSPLSTVVRADFGQHLGDSLFPAAATPSASASRAFQPADEPPAPASSTSSVFHPPRLFV